VPAGTPPPDVLTAAEHALFDIPRVKRNGGS